MELNTASAVISFYVKLEDQIASFYEDLANNEKYSEDREIFLAFAKENRRYKEMVLRVYREVITDAIEAGFITGLNENDYKIDTGLTEDMGFSDVLKKAIKIEEKSYKFCVDASESSGALLADIPEAFKRVAERKAIRRLTLESLLDKIRTK